ncbi:MAG: SAM-dependent DNA methyltransferase [Hydrogenothermus sp.]|nr:MAG: SAM-dependent DNA methyltransferase [Hydrogenothermus sp.]
MLKTLKENKRYYGEHLTPVDVCYRFILPEIKKELYNYIWIDLYAGKGNLIFPILEIIPTNERIDFFEKHIKLFDIQEEMVNYMIERATKEFNIPIKLAKQNIKKRDNLKDFPEELLKENLPVFHITNPPYLYIGYIKKHKHKDGYKKYLEYFQGEKKKLQDLYQIALFNDLKANLKKMIYIIPTNFIYGKSGSNEIRKRFLPYYLIRKAYLIEDKVFESTGINIGIFFFEKKDKPSYEPIKFKALKISKNGIRQKNIVLKKDYNYMAGNEFEEYIKENKNNCLNISFYLMKDEVLRNKGNNKVVLLNANKYNKSKGEYEKEIYFVNDYLYKKIKSNILWIRTIDTGSREGRAGLYLIEELGVDGILTEKPYRTHPIQVFFEPEISVEKQLKIKEEFNKTLEYLRQLTDSEFMTTYKYSNSEYIRKYLGLVQAKKLISTIKV